MNERSFDERRFEAERLRLLRRARGVVGSMDAEDVVQETFERAWRTSSARPGTDPGPWLRRIARNVAYDVLAKRKRARELWTTEHIVERAEQSVLHGEHAHELGIALDALPAVQRRAIVLHDLAGYSNWEIAALDGVGYDTVRTRLFRARRAMRSALSREAA